MNAKRMMISTTVASVLACAAPAFSLGLGGIAGGGIGGSISAPMAGSVQSGFGGAMDVNTDAARSVAQHTQHLSREAVRGSQSAVNRAASRTQDLASSASAVLSSSANESTRSLGSVDSAQNAMSTGAITSNTGKSQATNAANATSSRGQTTPAPAWSEPKSSGAGGLNTAGAFDSVAQGGVTHGSDQPTTSRSGTSEKNPPAPQFAASGRAQASADASAEARR
jgi:hypothetical protein